jgi:hypothetical protein
VCISCTNSVSGLTFDTHTYDNLQVIQTLNPCTTALSVNTAPIPTNPKAFTFDAVNTGSVGDWNTFFLSSTGSCDPTSCTLYGVGCSTAYSTAYPSGKLTIATSSTWAITSLRNSNINWVENVCLKCTNGQQTINYDNYQVVQSNNQCYTSLTIKSTPAATNPKVLAYSSSPATATVGLWTDFVTNSQTSPTCDPLSCSLLAVGCVNTYASVYPFGMLSITSPTTVTGNTNSHTAWTETVCVKCTNDNGGISFDTVFIDNYQVQ